MKDKKELLEQLRDDNFYTLLAREIDLAYHEEILIPRHKKIKKKKEREQRLGIDMTQVGNLGILIEDLNGIVRIVDRMLEE